MSEYWKGFYSDGLGFLNTLNKGSLRPELFTNEIVLNLAGMTIEKLFMAFLMYHDRMPNNHTLTDLVYAVQDVSPVEQSLTEMLGYLDSLQDLCGLDTYVHHDYTDEDRRISITATHKVFDMVRGELEAAAAG